MSRDSHTATLERIAVPRLRLLAMLSAFLTVVLLVVATLVERHDLEFPGYGAPHRWVLAAQLAGSVAMIAMTYASWTPRRVLRVGVAFQIFGAACVGYFESGMTGAKGASVVCIWILNFALVPTTPRRAALAAYGAAIASATLIVGAIVMGQRGAPTASEWLRLGITFMVATIAVITSREIYGLKRQVADARKLGAYALVEMLGQGGMGEVWRAEHQSLIRPAAIKLIRPDMMSSLGSHEIEAVHTRFRREVQATALLTSPHTIAVYDFGQTADGTLYYVMELLHGLDCEKLVALYGPQPASRVVHLLRQACESLAEAHQRGLVHRDVKPANLYTCAIGSEVDFVKVLDFGLVTGFDRDRRLTADGAVPGTPAYLAPEAVGHNQSDARTDVYALGCVAYWLLTGQLVFDAQTVGAMMAAHLRDEPVRPSVRIDRPIPEDLEAIVMSCLAKEPSARPQSARDLYAMLSAVDVPVWSREEAERWWHAHIPMTADAASGRQGSTSERVTPRYVVKEAFDRTRLARPAAA